MSAGHVAGAAKLIFAGTHRSLPVEQTLANLRPWLSRFGITRVANITGLDDIGIPTVLAVRPRSRSLSVSQGKGLTVESAKVSAIMESVEQHHAEEADLPLRLGSYRERARKGNPLDPGLLPAYMRVFDPDARVLWTEARSLDGVTCEVPFAMVHLNLTAPLPLGSAFFPTGSNGLASGNRLEEAVVHGACELIERDALALFYARSVEDQVERRLRLDTVDDPDSLRVLQRFDAAGVEVGVWDMTTDVGVACFVCSIVERRLDPFRRVGLARGAGCHLDRRVALSRALCEAAQSRLTRITGSRDDIQGPDFDAVRSEAKIREQQVILRDSQAVRSFAEVPTRVCGSFDEDLRWTQRQLERAGAGKILYVDLSREAEPFAVARVLIPGLEGAPDADGYLPGARVRALQERGACRMS